MATNSVRVRTYKSNINYFLGFQLTDDSLAYLQPLMAAAHHVLTARGWRVRLVASSKWHASILNLNHLSERERIAVWPEVEAAFHRGAWQDLGFLWQGLTVWPRSGVIVLASESYPALMRWGLTSWLDHPLFGEAARVSLKRYTPHFTVMRLQDGPANKVVQDKLTKEWQRVREQLEPIDPQRINVDRITFFVSEYAQGIHRHSYKGTIKIR